jgi:hypothetical protein
VAVTGGKLAVVVEDDFYEIGGHVHAGAFRRGEEMPGVAIHVPSDGIDGHAGSGEGIDAIGRFDVAAVDDHLRASLGEQCNGCFQAVSFSVRV